MFLKFYTDTFVMFWWLHICKTYPFSVDDFPPDLKKKKIFFFKITYTLATKKKCALQKTNNTIFEDFFVV